MAQNFAAAAQHYDDVAVLQRQTADELLERLSLMKISPATILDLGAGTGRNLALLHRRYPNARLIALDIAAEMLLQARGRFDRERGGLRRWLTTQRPLQLIRGDAEQLPLADASVDMVFANLALQWCQPQLSFSEIARVLRPGGLLMYTTLGPGTLIELRQAWAEVDSYPHVNAFVDMHEVGDAMMASGLRDGVLDVEPYTLHYPTARAMMQDLKLLGARNVNRGRRRGLTGKGHMQQVIAAYERFRVAGRLPASYEVIFGHGWKSDPPTQRRVDGSVAIAISDIGGRKS